MIYIGKVLGGKLMEEYLKRYPVTLNTTRICANNLIDMSIEISRIGFSNMKPNAVILVNKNEVFDGIAATPLVHLPINAAILFTDCNNLRKETLNEIKRLSPKGYKGIHVILVGNISKNVSLELNNYGFRTQHIAGHNHYETACMIPNAREEFKNILIISGEDYSEGIVTGYWSAHHGDPILYVQKNKIPCCTLEAIKKMNHINVYIIGSTKTVSKNVENYLSKLDNIKHLERIDGGNPYEIAVNFAKYKDHKTEFGWERNYKEGHAFTFGELNHPMKIIAGVLFAHMGKHTPLLLTKKDRIPSVVEKYIKSVKPMSPKDMPKPPFMHGFILGSTKGISHDAQKMIEDTLSIDHEMMDINHTQTMMHDSCHMMGMDHTMHDSCHMMNMDHAMHDSDHMMDMEDAMHGLDHMMNMKDVMHESDYMMNMNHAMQDSDHLIGMEDDMHGSDHMMNMNHAMHHLDHMYHMYKKHNDKDENHEEMNHDCNHKMSEDYASERLNSNYRRVSIDEILG